MADVLKLRDSGKTTDTAFLRVYAVRVPPVLPALKIDETRRARATIVYGSGDNQHG